MLVVLWMLVSVLVLISVLMHVDFCRPEELSVGE